MAGARSDSRLESARKADLARSYAAEAIGLITRSTEWQAPLGKELLDLLGKTLDMEPIRDTTEFQRACLDRLPGKLAGLIGCPDLIHQGLGPSVPNPASSRQNRNSSSERISTTWSIPA